MVSRYSISLLTLFLLAMASAGLAADKWKPLKKDGIHDPENPAINVLQEPADALSVLQTDSAGNKVDWARSLEYGFIEPRSSIRQWKNKVTRNDRLDEEHDAHALREFSSQDAYAMDELRDLPRLDFY